MRFRIIAASLCLSLLIGCAAAPATPVTSEPEASAVAEEQAEADTSALTQGMDALGFRVLGALDSPEENRMISPVCIGLLLTELAQGASGVSEQQLTSLLGEQMGVSAAILRAELSIPRAGRTLTLADSLWVRENFTKELLPTFTDRLPGEVHPLDFASPTASETINNWVSDATGGQIPTLIESIDPNTMLYLISAVNFQGKWQTAFDPTATTEQTFYAPSGAGPVAMMQQKGSYPYFETEDWQGAILPFADSQTELLICLPREGVQLTPDMLPDAFAQLEAQAFPQTLQLALPKLDLSAGSELSAPLSALGLQSLFDPEAADFSGMTGDRSLYVGKVAHQVRFTLDENGAKAAGAGSVELRKRSVPITIPMQVDRPFYFVVRDRTQRLNLFCGAIREP